MLDTAGYFFVYSFIGFLLETLYAAAVQGEFVLRKCFLFFPMCPVYGFGALAVLLLAGPFRENPAAVFGMGLLAASAAEYLTDLFYREVLGVPFWNYADLPLNINGRVCLLFSLLWGVLSVVLIRYVHPAVQRVIRLTPRWVLIAILLLFLADAAASTVLLARFKDRSVLNVFLHGK